MNKSINHKSHGKGTMGMRKHYSAGKNNKNHANSIRRTREYNAEQEEKTAKKAGRQKWFADIKDLFKKN